MDAVAVGMATTTEATTEPMALPSAVTTPWSAELADYLAVKDVLVASDPAMAKVAAGKLIVRLDGADMASMGAAHNEWTRSTRCRSRRQPMPSFRLVTSKRRARRSPG